MSNIPSDLKYTDYHEYVRLEGNIATVGITQYAVNQLGDITLVNIDIKIGDKVKEGNTIGTIESVQSCL